MLDLRCLVPLDAQAILASVRRTSRLFTVEENPRVLGWGAEVASIVADEAFYSLDAPIVRITTPHIPLPAAAVLEDAAVPTVDRIVATLPAPSRRGPMSARARSRGAPKKGGQASHDHVAVVGIGRMGTAMAGALARAGGIDLVLWNRTPDRARALATELGARVAGTPAEAARPADVCSTMLADDAAFDAVYGGPAGLLAGSGPARSSSTRAPCLPTRSARSRPAPGRPAPACSTRPCREAWRRPRPAS